MILGLVPYCTMEGKFLMGAILIHFIVNGSYFFAEFLYTVVQSQRRTCTTECGKGVAMSRCPIRLYLVVGENQKKLKQFLYA